MRAGRLSQWMRDHGGSVPIPCARMTIRTTTLRAIGGWQALPIGEDVDLLAGLAELTDGWQSSETAWLYRQHPDQISRSDRQREWGTIAR
jgi:hypothetical protein